MHYDERFHTPSALVAELEQIYTREPDTLLFGSLGRAILLGSITGNPAAEFEARRENPVRKVEYGDVVARDIDVVTPADTVFDLAPFAVDQKAFGSRQVNITNDNGDWYLVSGSKRVYEQLHPAVMEPIEAEGIYGAEGKTVSLQTHQHLFGLKGDLRPKDRKNLDFLSQFEARAGKRLPEELYEPFIRLNHLATTGWFNNTRRIYRAIIPEAVRHKVAPITSKIRDRLA